MERNQKGQSIFDLRVAPGCVTLLSLAVNSELGCFRVISMLHIYINIIQLIAYPIANYVEQPSYINVHHRSHKSLRFWIRFH
jgi:hypothetical protein